MPGAAGVRTAAAGVVQARVASTMVRAAAARGGYPRGRPGRRPHQRSRPDSREGVVMAAAGSAPVLVAYCGQAWRPPNRSCRGRCLVRRCPQQALCAGSRGWPGGRDDRPRCRLLRLHVRGPRPEDPVHGGEGVAGRRACSTGDARARCCAPSCRPAAPDRLGRARRQPRQLAQRARPRVKKGVVRPRRRLTRIG
jgi:hypothetical protein